MPTEKEIKDKHKKLHNELSQSYYAGKSGLTKEEFDTQHSQVWANMEAELIAGGFMPTPVAPVDWKAEWLAADTDNKKLKVLARVLKLE